MCIKKFLLISTLLCINLRMSLSVKSHADDDSNPLLDMASMFIQEALNNQNGNSGGGRGSGGAGASLAGVASLIGSFMQANSQGKSGGGGGGGGTDGSGAMTILSGLGTLLASAASNSNNNARGGNGAGIGGFDPSIIGNLIEMFTNNDDTDSSSSTLSHNGNTRKSDNGIGLESLLQLASAFINTNSANTQQKTVSEHNTHQHHKRDTNDAVKNDNDHENDNLVFLPLLMQYLQSFTGIEGQKTQEKHKSHAWVLPPFLERLHVIWDTFSNSELADALYQKSGINKILKGFKGRDGKLDYDKLFESLNNQSFRRRWIKSATLYLADWASYLANPEVYTKYFQTAQLMFNGFLKSQGYPKTTYFEPTRARESFTNLMDHIAKHHLNVEIDSQQYVKPAMAYAKDLMKLGQARGLLQFNSTEMSDKLTDTLNLEVIEPVLKVHRAYRFVLTSPACDRYVLCQLNSPKHQQQQQNSEKSRALISGVSPKIVKIGSIGAAVFISTETGTPFWSLFNVINAETNNCEVKYPADCSGFHEGEAKVTTEYVHNEL